MRKFERVTGSEANLPTRGTKGSAGYDFHMPYSLEILPFEGVLLGLGIKCCMNENEVLQVHIRSSIAIKKGLNFENPVVIIDSDYYNNEDNEGEIFIKLFNHTGVPVALKKGERVAQGIFMNYLVADDDNVRTERTGGIGSTGE